MKLRTIVLKSFAAILLWSFAGYHWSVEEAAAAPAFEDATRVAALGDEGFKMVSADLNRDGKSDLIVLDSQNMSVILGKGDGSFENVRNIPLGYRSVDATVGDFDGDGILDVIVAAMTEYTFYFHKGIGNGSFSAAQPIPLPLVNGVNITIHSVLSVDYDLNGRTDVMLKQSGGNTIWIYEWDGRTLSEKTNFGGNYNPHMFFPVFADVNNDGYPDLIANTFGTSDNITVELHKGTGISLSTNNLAINLRSLTRNIIVSDFNRDGNGDIVALDSTDNKVSILLGKGDGSFLAPVHYSVGSVPMSLAAGDFDGDGKTDLAVINRASNNVSILIGNGDGTFQPQIQYIGFQQGAALVAADFNGDGITDLAVTVTQPNEVVVLLSKSYGPSDALKSTVTVAPSSVTADGIASASITVTLKDAADQLIPNRRVALSQGGGRSTITPSTATTDANGVATFTVSNTKSETVNYAATDTDTNTTLQQTASVNFIVGATDAVASTFTATPASVVADGMASTVLTVTLKDRHSNPIAGHAVSLSQRGGSSVIAPFNATTDANGAATFTASSTKSETVIYTATDEDTNTTLQQTASVIFSSDATDAATSTITATPASVVADGTTSTTLTVTLKDSHSNPIAGHVVSLSQGSGSSTITPSTATTDANGVASFTVNSTKSETVNYTATDADTNTTIQQTASVNFIAGATDAVASTLTATPASVVADGTTSTTLTVTLKDSHSNPIAGHAVSLSQGGGSSMITPSTATTDANGVATFTVNSTKAETIIYTATDVDTNTTVQQTASVNFIAGATDAVASTLTATPASVVADGTTTTTLTVTLKDSRSNPIAGHAVSLSQGSGSSVIAPSTATTDANGVATFTASNTKAERVIFTASEKDLQTIVTQTAEVTFTSRDVPPVDNGGGSSGSSGSSNVLPSATARISAGESGQLSLGDEITLQIPAGASDQDLQATIQKLDVKSLTDIKQSGLLSPVFHIMMKPDMPLKRPATVRMKFDKTRLSEGQQAVLYQYVESKGWIEIGSSVAEGYVTGSSVDPGKTAVFAREMPSEPKPADRFPDIQGHWAEAQIKAAAELGLLNGYADGTMRPDRSVSRVEFAVLVMRALEHQGQAGKLRYTDSDKIGGWAQPMVAEAAGLGILNGYTDGSFRPNADISRAEMAVIVTRALGLPLQEGEATPFNDDSHISAWARTYISTALKQGLLEGRSGGNFAPDGTVTRAEAAVIMIRLKQASAHITR